MEDKDDCYFQIWVLNSLENDKCSFQFLNLKLFRKVETSNLKSLGYMKLGFLPFLVTLLFGKVIGFIMFTISEKLEFWDVYKLL